LIDIDHEIYEAFVNSNSISCKWCTIFIYYYFSKICFLHLKWLMALVATYLKSSQRKDAARPKLRLTSKLKPSKHWKSKSNCKRSPSLRGSSLNISRWLMKTSTTKVFFRSLPPKDWLTLIPPARLIFLTSSERWINDL
jgi:hypothetical protein